MLLNWHSHGRRQACPASHFRFGGNCTPSPAAGTIPKVFPRTTEFQNGAAEARQVSTARAGSRVQSEEIYFLRDGAAAAGRTRASSSGTMRPVLSAAW